MHTRNYQEISAAIRKVWEMGYDPITIKRLTIELADVMAADNERFNYGLFMATAMPGSEYETCQECGQDKDTHGPAANDPDHPFTIQGIKPGEWGTNDEAIKARNVNYV